MRKWYVSRYLTLRCVQTWGDKSPVDFPAGFLSEATIVSVFVQTSLHGFVQFPILALGEAMATHLPAGFPCLLWFCGHLLYSSSLLLFQAEESCSILFLLYGAVRYLCLSSPLLDWWASLWERWTQAASPEGGGPDTGQCRGDLYSGCVCAGHIHSTDTSVCMHTHY